MPYSAPYPYAPYPSPPTTHSGLGIASLVLTILGALLVLLALLLAVALADSPEIGEMDEMAVGLVVCGGGAVVLVGLALGVASCFQADRRKATGVAGIIIGAAVLLMVAGLMVIGLLAEGLEGF